MPEELTAKRFVERLEAHRSPEEKEKLQRYFKTGKGEYGEGDVFIGVRMGRIFELAKEFLELPTGELEELLDSPVHEVRAGAVSIMDKHARRKRTPEGRRRDLYELYLRRTDRINNWDLVDLGAPYVVGGYLYEYGQSRDVLYELARSRSPWERRTAIVATGYFIRQGDLDDTFRIAEVLLGDDHDLVHKATGWMLRAAGDSDRAKLLGFLDRHAATMPRTLLRYALEHLDKGLRDHYRGMTAESATRTRPGGR
jgi:3-methyladenine DNA glycosylase AlkD